MTTFTLVLFSCLKFAFAVKGDPPCARTPLATLSGKIDPRFVRAMEARGIQTIGDLEKYRVELIHAGGVISLREAHLLREVVRKLPERDGFLSTDECDFGDELFLARLNNRARYLLRAEPYNTRAHLEIAFKSGRFDHRLVGKTSRTQIEAFAKGSCVKALAKGRGGAF